MSFSKKVKEELIKVAPKSRHCQIAELAAIVYMDGVIKLNDDIKKRNEVLVATENQMVIKKMLILLSSLLPEYGGAYKDRTDKISEDMDNAKTGSAEIDKTNENAENMLRKNADRENIDNEGIRIKGREADKLISMLKIDKEHLKPYKDNYKISHISSRIITNTCCKRAFLRGVFLCAGSITNPEKKYHFELAMPDMEKAGQMKGIMDNFEMDAKIVQRKKQYVVYVKESERIADLLNIMGAHVSLMDMENIRILKGFRNSINRQVNCETANLNKTVVAAAKKIDDITYIRDTVGLSFLEPNLREIASIRLENPDASLKELGEMLSTPLGKSGVNHRLRKLGQIAEKLRGS